MLRRVMLAAFMAYLVGTGSALSAPRPIDHYDLSLKLPKHCVAKPEEVLGVWYININRNPVQPSDQPEKFAVGAFDAEVTVWVYSEGVQQLVTVRVGANEDGARVESGTVSTGKMNRGKILSVDSPKCDAFAAPPTRAARDSASLGRVVMLLRDRDAGSIWKSSSARCSTTYRVAWWRQRQASGPAGLSIPARENTLSPSISALALTPYSLVEFAQKHVLSRTSGDVRERQQALGRGTT